MRLAIFTLLTMTTVSAQTRPRARDLGVPFEGATGALNALADVPGVEVGHKTLIKGDSSQNGNGDMTGTHWLEESGFLDGPAMITNTHSVGHEFPRLFYTWLAQRLHRVNPTKPTKPAFVPWVVAMGAVRPRL
jgi:L-aminopeptidase/D-esterase-like protein